MIIQRHIIDAVYDVLVLSKGSTRHLVQDLATSPVPTTQEQILRLHEITEELFVAPIRDVAEEIRGIMEETHQVVIQQLQRCFYPKMMELFRVVSQHELHSMFTQLQLFRRFELAKLDAIDMSMFGGTSGKMVVGAAADLLASASSPTMNELPLLSNLSSAFSSPREGLASVATRPLASTPGPAPPSSSREVELHRMIEQLQSTLLNRAQREEKNLEEVRQRLTKAHEAQTVEMREQLEAKLAELKASKDANLALATKLDAVSEVAYVLDELCAKLNLHVIALKEIMMEHGVSSGIAQALDEHLEVARTTSCCQGQPLVVDGGWKFGEEPDTLKHLRELRSGSRDIPSVVALQRQQHLLKEVIQDVRIRRENSELRDTVEAMKNHLRRANEDILAAQAKAADDARKRVESVEQKLIDALNENSKLRSCLYKYATDGARSSRAERGTRTITPRTILSDKEQEGLWSELMLARVKINELELDRFMRAANRPSDAKLPDSDAPDLSGDERLQEVLGTQLSAAARALRKPLRPPSAPSTSARRLRK
jgi:hypothetical protein